jgi:hypothetical protein
MATTTPNFGWPVPTSGDLVKNGATAIEALGDAIDASMVDLEGGTTGQILSKASNTDMDFVWIANDQGDITGVTASSPLTGGGTSGAITVGILSATTSNLGAVQLSTSTSSTSTSLAATASAVKETYDLANRPASSNPVINSAFNVWQRGTTISLGASTSAANGFLADRWQTTTSSAQASTITRQATGDTTNLPFIQYALRYQRNSGQTGTALSGFYQSFETVNSIPFVGKTITLSFYARSGADFSPTSDAIAARVYSGTGTDQSIFSYTGSASVINETKNLTATWQRFTVTSAAPVATTATELAIGFEWTPTGTAGAADYFEVTGVQIDIGNVALPFRTAGVSYQQELALCQRYAYSHVNGNGQMVGNVYAFNSTQLEGVVEFPVTMRIAPTLTASSGSSYFATRYGGFTTPTVTIFNASTTSALLYAAVTGATTGDGNALNSNASQASILFVSEL